MEKVLYKIEGLQEKIKYRFKDNNILIRALTHSSFANEHKKMNIKYNERLEFLGDSVLNIIVSDYIFNKYPEHLEGDLTKLRATVVCEPVLANAAKKLDLGEYLLLGKGEEATGGRERASILADAFEALIAAIYIDGGLSNARKFVLNSLSNYIEKAVKGQLFLDYKTQLQEVVQREGNDKINYIVVKEEGPDHNKTFHIEVNINGKIIGKGIGKNKKEAEQSAAKDALVKLGVVYE
jgi:ribonuclease-3